MERELIKQVIEDSYIKAVYINRDTKAMEKGFHQGFDMLIQQEDNMLKFPLSQWIESIKQNIEKTPNPPAAEITYNIPLVDYVGNSAIAKVEIFKDGKQLFSDYISLYKFQDGWKIVGKTFHHFS